MASKLNFGLLHCEDRDVFYAELMFDNVQWGEVILDRNSGKPMITVWECNFTISVSELGEFISNAAIHLKEFEGSKKI